MLIPSPSLYAGGAGGGPTWTDLDLTAAAAGQDTQSQISGVTADSLTIANGAATYTVLADVAARYWTAPTIPGAGFLFLELELSAALPSAAAIGIGLAADATDLTTTPSNWIGRKQRFGYTTVQQWAKWGTGITTTNGGDRSSHRTMGIMGVCNSDGSVGALYEYSRDGTGAAQGYLMTPTQAIAAVGTFSHVVITAARTGDAGSAQSVSIAGIRYQFVPVS
jgi:hypothetical protein